MTSPSSPLQQFVRLITAALNNGKRWEIPSNGGQVDAAQMRPAANCTGNPTVSLRPCTRLAAAPFSSAFQRTLNHFHLIGSRKKKLTDARDVTGGRGPAHQLWQTSLDSTAIT